MFGVSKEVIERAIPDICRLRADIEELKQTDPTQIGAAKRWEKLWQLQAMLRWVEKGIVAVQLQEYSWGTWEREYPDPHMTGYTKDDRPVCGEHIRGTAYEGFLNYGSDYGVAVVEWDGLI